MNQPSLSNSKVKKSFGSQKKLQLRIDMTPMVDLGFLLISFFVITTQLGEPKTMNLIVPKEGPDSPVKGSTAITFLPASSNKLYYYFGDGSEAIPQNKVFVTDYKTNSIGSIISNRKNFLLDKKIDPGELFVIIKPSKKASYKKIVDLLDEMIIHNVSRYTLTELAALDTDFINNHN